MYVSQLLSTGIAALNLNILGNVPTSHAEYYCPGDSKTFYFLCESNLTTKLVVNVLPFFENAISLNLVSQDNNVIVRDPVTVFIETIELNSDGLSGHFVTYLWINTIAVDSEVVVFCEDGTTNSNKTLLPLRGVYIHVCTYTFGVGMHAHCLEVEWHIQVFPFMYSFCILHGLIFSLGI